LTDDASTYLKAYKNKDMEEKMIQACTKVLLDTKLVE
jgi:hypothetical protein